MQAVMNSAFVIECEISCTIEFILIQRFLKNKWKAKRKILSFFQNLGYETLLCKTDGIVQRDEFNLIFLFPL